MPCNHISSVKANSLRSLYFTNGVVRDNYIRHSRTQSTMQDDHSHYSSFLASSGWLSKVHGTGGVEWFHVAPRLGCFIQTG